MHATYTYDVAIPTKYWYVTLYSEDLDKKMPSGYINLNKLPVVDYYLGSVVKLKENWLREKFPDLNIINPYAIYSNCKKGKSEGIIINEFILAQQDRKIPDVVINNMDDYGFKGGTTFQVDNNTARNIPEDLMVWVRAKTFTMSIFSPPMFKYILILWVIAMIVGFLFNDYGTVWIVSTGFAIIMWVRAVKNMKYGISLKDVWSG